MFTIFALLNTGSKLFEGCSVVRKIVTELALEYISKNGFNKVNLSTNLVPVFKEKNAIQRPKSLYGISGQAGRT